MSESAVRSSQPHPTELSARLGARAHLLGIRLTRLEAREGAGAFDDGPYDVEISLSPSFNIDDTLVVYTFDFTVKIAVRRKNALKVRVTYETAFFIPEDNEFTEDELKAFGAATAVRVVHPYLRRQIHGLTFEFGMPAAIIDLLRVRLPDPMST